MQILPIDPSFQRVILQGNRSPEGLQLTLGQQIAATVLKINEEGQLLLGFGAQKVWARSEFPLAEGQQLQLRVNQNGATIELQLLDTTTDSAVENYELATLLQASAGRGGTATGEANPTRILQGLQQLLKSDSQLLTEPQSRQLRSLLEPLTVGSDSKTLLPQIKNLIENSGIFFEAKLRTVLEALDASPEAALQKVASDLKLLLGQLRQPPSSSTSTPAEAQTTLTASVPPGPPLATKPDPEQATAPDGATNLPRSETSLNLAARQGGLPERLAALRNLLELMKASPDQALQRLSNEVAALLQTAKPEQFLTPTSTKVDESFLKQAGVLSTTTQAPAPEPLGNQKQIPTQSGEGEVLSKPVPPPLRSADTAQDLDHKVRQLLEAVRSTPEPETRKLLPELVALVTQTKEQTASALSDTALAHNKSTVLEQTAVLSDQVLSRQTEAAFEWLKNGAFQAELPMQFGTHSTQAKIRFFQETEKDSKGHSGRPLNINIYLDLPDTGKLEAWARWEGAQIQATLYVRDAATRELFESQLQELSANLREAGFATAVLDVRVDPARLYKIQESVEQTLPQEGSLLSLRV